MPMLQVLRRRDPEAQRFRRGMYLLPSLFIAPLLVALQALVGGWMATLSPAFVP